ncbi:MAG TPA: glycoside hydrolase family 3 N-terminal domain-containing protein [bacterium]|nr:glycoside hydrolase family 3 N-terminal domain-containing protein [bacterium]
MMRRWPLPLLLAATLAFVGLRVRAPYFLAWREALPGLCLIAGLFLAWRWRRQRALAILLLFGGSVALCQNLEFGRKKAAVLRAEPELLRTYGSHFIVGYQDFAEIRELVRRGAVGGIFVTTRNIAGKSAVELRSEIAELQELQAQNGLPPLYVATDQEGGAVSRLSPLVPLQPSLAAWLKTGSARDYAALQARALAGLGVNLNFSPVVDLKHPALGEFGPSLLAQRAIAADPAIVGAAAGEYCRGLEENGVRCTLKHFPGLGRVEVDTHWREGEISGGREELEKKEWRPFREVLAQSPAFLMVGHARVSAIDPEHPASISRALVQGLIRLSWGHEGIVVTDDLAMAPIYDRKGGVGAASVQALNAGVDLLLLSYDGELYYEAMAALLKAAKSRRLDQNLLSQSARRLAHNPPLKKGGRGDFAAVVNGKKH